MTFSGKYGPLLIAEIGGNHEGDFGYAKALTDLAIESEADAIKFQIYFPDTLVNRKQSPDRWRHFKKFTFTVEQHIELAKKCKDAGKDYLASVWDINAIEWIDNELLISVDNPIDLLIYNQFGDVNLDMEINILDITKILQFILELEVSTAHEFCASDANNDAIINLLDILIIVSWILSNN